MPATAICWRGANASKNVSVRLTPPEAQRLYQMAVAGRRTLSQTLRILLEPLLKAPQQGA